ncbi:MAG TPA: hypothetical protein VEW48_24700 [Thermoanaerobaculia bacterium]|nr:hypothetical protein [Thermoanaerobaculia bacterium]
MRFKVRVWIGILSLLACSAKGQFLLFTPPGGPESRPETIEDRLDREIRQAPYHLGPVRIAPLVGFRDVAYVRDLFSNTTNSGGDLTATLGAGARGYLHTGSKVIWVGQVLPEYVWWQKRADARRLNLSEGLEMVSLLNRLTVDAAASRIEQQRIVTPEVPELVDAATEVGRLDVELKLTSKLRPFVSARRTRQEGLVEDRHDDPLAQRIALLDRNDHVLRAGLHWIPRTGWIIGVGAERSRVDFDRAALDSSNEGTAPVLELTLDRPHIFFHTDLAARSLTATSGSRFVDYDGVTGSASVNVVPRSSFQVWLYANRELLYSVSPDYPYLQDERVGLALGSELGRRVVSRVFVETGDDKYTAFSPAAPERSDDLTAYGGSLRFTITETLALSLQATRLELASNQSGFNRSYTSGSLTFSLRGNLFGQNL